MTTACCTCALQVSCQSRKVKEWPKDQANLDERTFHFTTTVHSRTGSDPLLVAESALPIKKEKLELSRAYTLWTTSEA